MCSVSVIIWHLLVKVDRSADIWVFVSFHYITAGQKPPITKKNIIFAGIDVCSFVTFRMGTPCKCCKFFLGQYSVANIIFGVWSSPPFLRYYGHHLKQFREDALAHSKHHGRGLKPDLQVCQRLMSNGQMVKWSKAIISTYWFRLKDINQLTALMYTVPCILLQILLKIIGTITSI